MDACVGSRLSGTVWRSSKAATELLPCMTCSARTRRPLQVPLSSRPRQSSIYGCRRGEVTQATRSHGRACCVQEAGSVLFFLAPSRRPVFPLTAASYAAFEVRCVSVVHLAMLTSRSDLPQRAFPPAFSFAFHQTSCVPLLSSIL
jgi:hypothetical protein